MPMLTADRTHNRNVLKAMIQARRKKARAVAGAIGGIEKRHADMAAAVAEMRQLLQPFSDVLAEATAGGGRRRRHAAAVAAAHAVRPLLERTIQMLVTEESANQRAVDAARTADSQLNTFVADTVHEVNRISKAVTDVDWHVVAPTPLRPGNELINPQGRVFTTLYSLNNVDRTFSVDTNTLFARRRGSAPRRPNLPGTAAARARATEGVVPLRPEAPD
jgi:hypothetical protein